MPNLKGSWVVLVARKRTRRDWAQLLPQLPAVAVDAMLGLTFGAMRGVASDAMPDGAGPDGVAVEEDGDAG